MARRTAGEGVKGIVFLAFDEAGFMTGSSLVIDGGFTAQ
jgi:NAD(P)-dependent dehydrogenase (short-subunit alcohol dehydrogenase family)